MKLILTSLSLTHREILKFVRVRNRLTGAFLQPLIFWVILGSGMKASFKPPGFDIPYMDYIFPGIILMIVLFTAIFSTFSIIEDRKEGFLQGVLASPAPRASIIFGKCIGGSLMGLFQSLLMCAIILTPFVDLSLSLEKLLLLIIILFYTGFLLTNLGFVFAWPMKSTQGFHAIMTVLLFPMWIFSGAAFPVEGVPIWLEIVMQINPLTHALKLIQYCFDMSINNSGNFGYSILYLAIWSICLLLVSLRQIRSLK
ncbi:MAG: ABC transporter permease [Lentisphaeria bacterium]|nr:ABC transporter permease [Lentisphaeria bacterium]NQZ67166.1 ABC transporter permease [Lentisphaeria bacterium]